MLGWELGFSPPWALQCFYVINGKLSLPGETTTALIQRSPLCKSYDIDNMGEGDERCGLVLSWRKGREKPNKPVKFTLAEAKKAGLYPASQQSTWMRFTDDMLIWKAVARDARRNWSDVTKGTPLREEVEEIQLAPVTVQAEVVSEPDPLLKEINDQVPTGEPAGRVSSQEADVQGGSDPMPEHQPAPTPPEPTLEDIAKNDAYIASRKAEEEPAHIAAEPPPEEPAEPPAERILASDTNCPVCDRINDIIVEFGHHSDCVFTDIGKRLPTQDEIDNMI